MERMKNTRRDKRAASLKRKLDAVAAQETTEE